MLRSRRHQSKQRGRSAILWSFFAYFGMAVAMTAAFDSKPEFFDIEYGIRLNTLRQRQAEFPNRPLLLAVGSSRTVMSFAPERLPPLIAADGRQALPFNFGHIGAGPVLNLTEVTRMIRDGVMPRWLFLELMPSQLCHETQFFVTQNTTWSDLPVLHPHMSWNRLYGEYLLRRLKSGPKIATELVRRRYPEFALTGMTDASEIMPLGGCTFLKDDVTREDRIHLTEITRRHLQEYLANFKIGTRGDGTTRALLNLLCDLKIPTTIVLMPEGTLMRSWYAPGANEQFERYCASLCREYGLNVVDAREWLSDDDMYDEHHALKRGAATFTDRLGREVLIPFLATGDTSWAARFEFPSNRKTFVNHR